MTRAQRPKPSAGSDGKTLRELLGGGSRQIVAALIGFLTFPIITRLLDSEQFGAWMIIGQASFLIALADLGLTASVQRTAVTQDHPRAHRTLSLALLTNATLLPTFGLIAYGGVVLLVGSEPLRDQVLGATPVALLGGVAGGLTGPIRGFVFARGGSRYVANARTLGSLVFLVVISVAFALGWGLFAPAVALLCNHSTDLLLTGWAARRLDPHLRLRPAWPKVPGEAKVAFRDGAAGFSINVSSMLQTSIDVFVLGAFATLEIVGGYRIGLRAPELAYLLTKPALTPLMAQLGDPAQRTRAVRLATGVFAGAIVSGMTALAFAGQPLLVLWLGDKAAGEVPGIVLMLMSFAVMLLSLFEAAGQMVMLGSRNAWTSAIPAIIGTVVNLGISLGGVHFYGVWAVAGSTVVGYFVTGTLLWRRARTMLGWRANELFSCMVPPLFALTMALGAALTLRPFAMAGPLQSFLSCLAITLLGLAAAAGGLRLTALRSKLAPARHP